jgi:hypothetical protein
MTWTFSKGVNEMDAKVGLLDQFNREYESAQEAFLTSLTNRGSALGEAFEAYNRDCAIDHEAFKAKMHSIHERLYVTLHGGAGVAESAALAVEAEIREASILTPRSWWGRDLPLDAETGPNFGATK